MLPTKAPIANAKGIHFGSKLIRVVICKLEPKEGSKLSFPRLYPAIEILSVESIRPTENRQGIIVEGILVNKEGDMLPGNAIVRDVTIPFDQQTIRFGDSIWSDDENLCQSFAALKAEEFEAETSIRIKELEEHRSLLTSIIEHGA